MFVAVEIIRKKRIRNKITVNEIALPMGSFFSLKVCSGKKINWRKVSVAAGRERCRLLIPENVILPENCDIKKYQSSEFARECLYDVFVKIISAMPGNSAIGIIDYNGYSTNVLPQLLRTRHQLFLYTGCPEKFEAIGDYVLKYGTCPVFTNNLTALDNLSAVIDPFSVWKMNKLNCPVFGLDNDADYYIGEDSFVLPEWAENTIPKGIAKLDFLAAAEKLCGANINKNDVCLYLCKNGGKTSLNSVVLSFTS